MKRLVSIIFILNIFAGFFVEAFQTEIVDYHSAYQLVHPNLEPATDNQNSSEHSENECILAHCHFGHCASLVPTSSVSSINSKSTDFFSDRILNPREFIFGILRPPISAS